MAPFIGDAECVRVRQLRDRPRRGEVVLCRGEDDRLYLHRVIRLTGTGVITRGDALTIDDQPFPFAAVLGRAVAVSGRRRLHLCFPFGVVISRRRWRFLRSVATPRMKRVARRLQEIGARM